MKKCMMKGAFCDGLLKRGIYNIMLINCNKGFAWNLTNLCIDNVKEQCSSYAIALNIESSISLLFLCL